MARVTRKSTTARTRRRKKRKAAPNPKSERTLLERLKDRPLEPPKPITVSAEQWAEMRRRAAEWQRGLRSIDRAGAPVASCGNRPPWMGESAPAFAPAQAQAQAQTPTPTPTPKLRDTMRNIAKELGLLPAGKCTLPFRDAAPKVEDEMKKCGIPVPKDRTTLRRALGARAD
jgi:hypothetical protein